MNNKILWKITIDTDEIQYNTIISAIDESEALDKSIDISNTIKGNLIAISIIEFEKDLKLEFEI